MASSAIRGRTDRIAFIHAVYALIWAGLAGAADLPIAAAVSLCAVTAFLLWITFGRLGTNVPAPSRDDARIGSRIRQINLATGGIAVLVIVLAHAWHADALIVPGVLLVMGVHFLPLWQLLGRASMVWMALALIVAAAVAYFTAPRWIGPVFAAIIFAINSVRLVWFDRR